MATEYRRLSRCGIDGCKQTLFHLDAGQWFCKNGHLREGELEVEAEDQNFGLTGARAQRIEVSEKRVHKVLRGRKGFELYIQCVQLVLQKQVWWLIHSRGFADELEAIVRDLWTLRLQILTTTLEEREGRSQSQATQSQRSDAGGETDVSSQSSYVHSSAEDSASTTHSSWRRRRRAQQRHVPKSADRPKLIDTVCLCYLGLVILRSGVSLGDFHCWVEGQEILYFRAIKEVPEAMKDKLSAEYWSALDPPAALGRGRLYHTVHTLVVLLQERFGMTFPRINKELLLGRYINELGLPLEVYPAVKKLADHLYVDFAWPALAKRKRKAHWPEVRLMGMVIVAAKLLYGLDGVQRVPETEFEPAATGLEWEAWEEFLKSGSPRKGTVLGKLAMDVTERDVLGMDERQLDWYMDWYEKTWIDAGGEEASEVPQGLLNLFPTKIPKAPEPPSSLPETLPGSSGAPSNNNLDPDVSPLDLRLRALHASTTQHVLTPKLANARRSRSPDRPGEKYLLSSSEDEMPRRLKVLTQAAADILAIGMDDLRKAIASLEYSLKRGLSEARRAKRRKVIVEVRGGVRGKAKDVGENGGGEDGDGEMSSSGIE